MRTEQEMLELIIGTAEQDYRIHAVLLGGSRTNPNAPRDIFQDYDIIYVVSDTSPFREDRGWIDRFGPRLYMQYPEDSGYYPHDVDNCWGWLIQLADGNRLDLHVCTPSYTKKELERDRLCRMLLDKRGLLPPLPPPADEDYWVQRPSEKEFLDTCNEFWWCLNNVAKGLWREEIPYVMDMLNDVVRPQLIRLLSWKAGILTGFSVSVGKSAKYLYRWLPEPQWESLLTTYPSGQVAAIWASVFTMCRLFEDVAEEVAAKLGFSYNREEAAGSLKFLRDVHVLPQDATDIYP